MARLNSGAGVARTMASALVDRAHKTDVRIRQANWTVADLILGGEVGVRVVKECRLVPIRCLVLRGVPQESPPLVSRRVGRIQDSCGRAPALGKLAHPTEPCAETPRHVRSGASPRGAQNIARLLSKTARLARPYPGRCTQSVRQGRARLAA